MELHLIKKGAIDVAVNYNPANIISAAPKGNFTQLELNVGQTVTVFEPIADVVAASGGALVTFTASINGASATIAINLSYVLDVRSHDGGNGSQVIMRNGKQYFVTTDYESFPDINGGEYEYIIVGNLQDLAGASGMTIGRLYKIPDGNGGFLYFRAATTSKLEKDGIRVMLCPAYYGTGENNGDGNSWAGVWYADHPGYAADDLVIWGGKVWKNLSGNNGSDVDDVSLDVPDQDWQEISKLTFAANEYIPLVFGCSYDLEHNWVEKQWDGAGNVFGIDYNTQVNDWQLVANPCDMSDWNFSTSGNSLYGNKCIGVWNNSAGIAIAANNLFDGYINRNSNSGQIYFNNCHGLISQNTNTGGIYNNSNYGNIETNSNAGDIFFNSNSGAISSNGNTGNIDNNSNRGEINGNVNNGSIRHNSNLSTIILNTNTVTDIEYNANTDSIDNNGNAGAIAFNTNLGQIIYNSNGGDVQYNSCLGVISANTNDGNIQYNSNNGNIVSNSNIGAIEYNSNNGDIASCASGSDPCNIANNINNGQISGTYAADVTDTIVNK